MNIPGLKELIGNSMMIFLGGMLALYFIGTIVSTIKNKTQKRPRQQITHKTTKTDLCRNLLANMQQDFIGERQIIFNELVRM